MKPPSTPVEPPSGAAAGSAPARPPRPSPRLARRAVPVAGPRIGRQFLLVAVGVLAFVIVVAAITGDRGWLDVKRQRGQLARLTAETTALQEENARLLAEVRALRTDPATLERLAREKLGYARPGEITFRFPPTVPPVAPARPPAPAGGSR